MDMITFEFLPNDVRMQILCSLCEHSEEGIFILDETFRFEWANLSYENIIGYPLSELQGRKISVYPLNELRRYPQSLITRIKKTLIDTHYFQEDVSYVTCYDTHVTTNLTIWCVKCYGRCYYVGLLRSITAAKDTALAQKQAINYNPITTLPNRHYFITEFNTLITNSELKMTVVILSIDKFRMISNTLNEENRNDLLKQVTSRLHSLSLNHLHLLAHFDENKLVMLFTTDDQGVVSHELEKVMQSCQSPFAIAEHRFYLNFLMGVSVFPTHGQHIDSLSRSAEIALQAIRSSGGNGVRWYDERMNQKTLEQLKLETELHTAFKTGQFVPYYQPKIELDTGHFIGFEALVRWNHPVQGVLDASQFVQTIINNHLTYDLFKLMAKSTIAQLNEWLENGYDVNVCLNVDAAEFRHPDFINCLKHMLSLYPECHSKVYIEITETSLLINDETAAHILEQLRQLDIGISLDDFGTGYSSLSYLQHYQFDCIKIDKSFTNNLHNDPKNFAIVSAIVSLAHSMQMKVIAEGIECIEQIDKLTSIRCDYGQGFFIGRPLSTLQATQLLTKNISCPVVAY